MPISRHLGDGVIGGVRVGEDGENGDTNTGTTRSTGLMIIQVIATVRSVVVCGTGSINVSVLWTDAI